MTVQPKIYNSQTAYSPIMWILIRPFSNAHNFTITVDNNVKPNGVPVNNLLVSVDKIVNKK